MVSMDVKYVEVNGRRYDPGDTIRVARGSEVTVKPVVCIERSFLFDPTVVGGTLTMSVEVDGASGSTSGDAGYGCYTAPFKWVETRSGEMILAVKAHFEGLGIPGFPTPTPIILDTEQKWRYVVEGASQPAPEPKPPTQPQAPLPRFSEEKLPWLIVATIGAVGVALVGIALALKR